MSTEYLQAELTRKDLQIKAMGQELTALPPTPQIEHLLRRNISLQQQVMELQAEVLRLQRELEGKVVA